MKRLLCLLTLSIFIIACCSSCTSQRPVQTAKPTPQPVIKKSETPSPQTTPTDANAPENLSEKFSETLSKAEESFQKGDYDKAEQYYKEAAKLDDKSGSPLNGLARIYLMKRKLDTALEYFDKSIKKDPKNHHNLLGKAEVYILKSDYDKAIGEYEKAAKIAPEDADTTFGIGKIYSLKYDFKKSEEYFTKAIKKDPEVYVYYLYRSFSRIQQADLENARKDAEKVMKLKPRMTTPYLAIAEIEERSGNPEKAIALYNRAIEVEKKNSAQKRFDFGHKENPIVGRGVVYLDMGEPEKAIKDFETAYNDPDNPKDVALAYMAEAYMRMGNRKKAKEMAARWFATDADDMEHYNKYDQASLDAINYAILGKYEKALEKINIGMKRQPERFAYDRGWIYFYKGDYEKSRKDLINFIEHNPNTMEAAPAKKLLRQCNEKLGNKAK